MRQHLVLISVGAAVQLNRLRHALAYREDVEQAPCLELGQGLGSTDKLVRELVLDDPAPFVPLISASAVDRL
jgi:hypothetical protein